MPWNQGLDLSNIIQIRKIRFKTKMATWYSVHLQQISGDSNHGCNRSMIVASPVCLPQHVQSYSSGCKLTTMYQRSEFMV